MPCVFKFTTSETSIDLTVGSKSYATCNFNAGEHFTTFSSLSCTVTQSVPDNTNAYGTITVPLAFNVGGSGRDVDTTDAKCFTTGDNTVTFSDGDKSFSTTANFEGAGTLNDDYESSRLIPSLGKTDALLVAPLCSNGYKSGTIGFSSKASGYSIDCNNIQAGITSQLNAWGFPTDSQSFSYTTKCTTTSYSITFSTIPKGLRPFIDAYIKTPTSTYAVTYTFKYVCADGKSYNSNRSLNWSGYVNGDADSEGMEIVVATTTGTGSTTGVTTLPFDKTKDKTKTIQVIEPIPTTTVTTSYLGVTTSFSTITATIGGTATVIVDEPYHSTTTVYKPWTGEGTTTYTVTASDDSIDTVVIETPGPNPTVTTTEYEDVSAATTYTETATHGGTDTVHVIEPINPT
ncbi:Agglutinin-like protein 1, partial [Candida tropicalis]